MELFCNSHDAIRYRVTLVDNKFIFESMTPKDDPVLIQENKRQKVISEIIFREHDLAVSVLDIDNYKPGRKEEYIFLRNSQDGEIWADPGWSDEKMTIKWESEDMSKKIHEYIEHVKKISVVKCDMSKKLYNMARIITNDNYSDEILNDIDKQLTILEKMMNK